MRIFSAVALSALLGSCVPNPPLLDQIRTLGELHVVTRNAPTTFYYGANERYGIEYELAQAFADHLGVRLRVHTADRIWDIFSRVSMEQVHIAAAGLSATAPRQELVDFGPTYQTVTPHLIYRMGGRRPDSLADLAGFDLEVQAGSAHVGLLYRAIAEHPDLNWSEGSNTSAETLMRRVADGRVDYAIVNSNEFKLLRNYYPEVRVAFDLESVGDLAWALPEGADDLREAVGEFFAVIESNGELQGILDRYYVARRDFDFVGASAFRRHLKARFPQYRDAFLAAGRETGMDWRLLAAIAYQESHWKADAVSPTGVKGLMMLTAKTASMVEIDDRADPYESILGGARYLARVLVKFPERIPYEDRILMAIAAYNIGFGHVEDARIITEMRGGDPDSWDEVRAHLPLLADEEWHTRVQRGYAQGSVPVQYVDNIRHYFWLLERATGTEMFSALPEPDSVTAAIAAEPI